MARCPRTHSRMRGLFVIAPLLLLGATGLGACSSSSTGSSSTTASGSAKTATTGSGGSAASAAAQLKDLSSSVKSAQKATFKAVYTSTSNGTTQTITLEQAPPKQLFSTTGGSQGTTELLNTGTTTYTCTSDASGATTCTSLGGTIGAGALSGIIGIYNGTAALTAMSSWESIAAAHVAGASLALSSGTIAGQPVKCAKWSYQGASTNYCVTTSGVLAKVETSGGSGTSGSGSNFVLTSFTTSVPDSDFALPQGATVVTMPPGVSVP